MEISLVLCLQNFDFFTNKYYLDLLLLRYRRKMKKKQKNRLLSYYPTSPQFSMAVAMFKVKRYASSWTTFWSRQIACLSYDIFFQTAFKKSSRGVNMELTSRFGLISSGGGQTRASISKELVHQKKRTNYGSQKRATDYFETPLIY